MVIQLSVVHNQDKNTETLKIGEGLLNNMLHNHITKARTREIGNGLAEKYAYTYAQAYLCLS